LPFVRKQSAVFVTAQSALSDNDAVRAILMGGGLCAQSHVEVPGSTWIYFRRWTDKMIKNFMHTLKRNQAIFIGDLELHELRPWRSDWWHHWN